MFGLSFSIKRALGITGLKTKISKKTGIPMTKNGLERKIGGGIIKLFKVIILLGIIYFGLSYLLQ